ncbi:FUSC family protein [Acidisoma sp. C75]
MASELGRILRRIEGGLWEEAGDLARNREGLREPLKAVCSVLLATYTAAAMHLPDVIWAALSGFLVMRSSLSESLPRALHRVLGTIAGGALGLCLARWAAGDMGVMMLALFVIIWLAVYQGSVSAARYAWLLFGITATLVLIAGFSDPPGAAAFAAVRMAEVAIGALAALLVAALFEAFGAPPGQGAAPLPVPGAGLSWRNLQDEAWLARNWPLVIHAAQAGIAICLLPVIWRVFDITDYAQTAITAVIVMIVPLERIAGGAQEAVHERMIQRILGCGLGGLVALIAVVLAGDDRLAWTLCLAGGVWIGFHIQSGRSGLSYLGTQFAFAFLVAFVQGPGPATSLNPLVTRLLGVLIGTAVASLVILAWPAAAPRAGRA